MRGREQDRFVDELLEATLARYRSAEPRPGLEERILATLQAREQSVPRFGLSWQFLLATAAGLLVTVGLLRVVRQDATPVSAPSLARPTMQQSAPSVRTPTLPSQVAAVQRTRSTGREAGVATPRRERFPSPAGFSEQELLLISFVTRSPADVLARGPALGQPIQELKIEPLEIPRLVIESSPSSQIDRHGR